MDKTCNINDHTDSQTIRHLINWISFRATSLPSICWLFLFRNARLVAPSLDYWGEIAVRDARYFCIGNLAARSIFTCITMIALFAHFAKNKKPWPCEFSQYLLWLFGKKWNNGKPIIWPMKYLLNMPRGFIDHPLSRKVKASWILSLKYISRSYAIETQVREMSKEENLRDCEIHFL